MAELFIPAPILSPRTDRAPIPHPEEFGARAGYWEVHRSEHDGAPFVDGLRAVLEVDADVDDLTEIEDRALYAGRLMNVLLSIEAGAGNTEPELVRVARCSTRAQLITQWDYFYRDEQMSAVPFEIFDFTALAQRLMALDQSVRRRVELAGRWYGVAAGAPSAVDKFLACWIALEAISPILDERWHKPEDICELCRHSKKQRRRPHNDGIEHLIRRMAPELLDGRHFSFFVDLRDALAHADPTRRLLQDAQIEEIANDIAMCTGSAILSAFPGGEEMSGAAPRDMTPQPTSRSEIDFGEPLPGHEPFNGGWIPFVRGVVEKYSWVGPDGVHRRAERPQIQYLDIKTRRPITTYTMTPTLTHFERDGSAIDLLEGLPGETVAQWRPREMSPLKRRHWSEFGEPTAAISRTDQPTAEVNE